MHCAILLNLLLSALAINFVKADKPTFKICVPVIVLPACNELMNKRSDIATIECVTGRDRLDCLDKVERREADFMAVDPEDLYLAFKKKNEDFTVFSDIRTQQEIQAEFRYEGILLIKKNSGINSLADLRGKRSCHTGYGRNVGYKIPITKLKKHGIFKIDPDINLSPVERELKGLSELFSQSCLVGKYSNNAEVDEKLKRSYSNLCALCENPEKCDYPDKYSGYEGAIKCLVENGGDVAFTKVIFVRKYFGLPIGHATKSQTEAQANANDFEYLCEDGTKVPITEKACSWAQRPWQAYMGNGDIIQKQLDKLQQRLTIFYDDAKSTDHKVYAKQMMVNEQNTVVAKDEVIVPGDHLSKAKYTDVIERQLLDGISVEEKIKLCVSSVIELKKCRAMSDVSYSRDIRPTFQCILQDNEKCVESLNDGTADAIIIQSKHFEVFDLRNLKAILFEQLDDDKNDKYVVVTDDDISYNEIKKAELKFDPNNLGSVNAALNFLTKQKSNSQSKICPQNVKSAENGKLEIINSKDLSKLKNKKLVCKDMTTTRPLTDFKTCNFDFTLPGAVYVSKSLNFNRESTIKHTFIALSEKFGHKKPFEDVFELFGKFEEGQKDVIFNDHTKALTVDEGDVSTKDYSKMRCLI
ncbi:hypothetical protein PVAND_007094 [Polypedilum vanderplanki]|uniref:Transferrin n=1 Tax=Polypedilum vanderplanki TaxID=319348 RepID=A0A9J6C6T4_POLVA|nr:hypothetical protein PVAND_007094 [Polypedilum vanderplanki]